MPLSCAFLLLVALSLAPSPPAAAERSQAVLVVESGDAGGQALGRAVERELKGRALRWLAYSEDELRDPVYKGKLGAALQAARLVVAVGDDPSALAFAELEDTPLYFVSSTAPGEALGASRASGLLAYSPEDVLGALPPAWKARLGLLYTPGYEPVLESIRATARTAGVTLAARRVARRGELPEAARALLESTRAVWVLGDPLLSRGAGLEHLVEQSLSYDVPLIGAGAWEVSKGMTFCSQGRAESLARLAARRVASLISGKEAGPRLELSPSGGWILFNRALSSRFGLVPRPPSWQEAR